MFETEGLLQNLSPLVDPEEQQVEIILVSRTITVCVAGGQMEICWTRRDTRRSQLTPESDHKNTFHVIISTNVSPGPVQARVLDQGKRVVPTSGAPYMFELWVSLSHVARMEP